jgi:hypothetical protein
MNGWCARVGLWPLASSRHINPSRTRPKLRSAASGREASRCLGNGGRSTRVSAAKRWERPNVMWMPKRPRQPVPGRMSANDPLTWRTCTFKPKQDSMVVKKHTHAALSAFEISLNVAFSASLTGTPPTPKSPPPSFAASATCWLICCNQPL